MERYTHIVVGAGSAGCVVASRLSEDQRNSVLLIEAGGRDLNPMFHIPLGTGKLLRTGLYGWKYSTEPDARTNGRRILWPRGKVLGGCSSINGMVYIRGAPEDYNSWAEAGNGWSYAEVLPYFLRSEHHYDRQGALHSTQGPLAVTKGVSPNPLYDAFVDAAVGSGYDRVEDFNSPARNGFGRFDFNIHHGRRSSAATAFLKPALKRSNLRLVPRAEVTRILVEERRATGIEYLKGKRLFRAEASAEVVLCAGAINSPKLLLQSGIGDAGHLSAMAVPVRVDLPGVGRNLRDHTVVAMQFGCGDPITLHSQIRIDRAVKAMAQAWFFRSGPATSFPTEAGGFTKSRPELPAADLQWHFTIGLGSSRLRIPGVYPLRPGPLEREGFTISLIALDPRSSGRIALRSPNPRDPPVIEAGYLSDGADLDCLTAGVRQARGIVRHPAIARYITEEIAPGPAVEDEPSVHSWISRSLQSAHHQAGSCRMGQGQDSVVDAELKVRGIEGLRVADASIMPSVIRGNTNAAVIMIAEKAADLIRGLPAPAPDAAIQEETQGWPQPV